MTNSYQEWLRERETTRANATRIPTPPPVTVEGDVWVPALQAVLISGVLFLAGFGFPALLGVKLATSFKVGVGLFLAALVACMVKFILDQRRRITEPLDMVWEKIKMLMPRRRYYGDDDDTPILVTPYRGGPLLPATVDHAIESIEPNTDPRTKRLYSFIVKVWPTGKCTREHCTNTLGIPRRDWERYIGGIRGKEGQESGRGLLDRAGVVEKTSKGWQIVAPLDKVFAINDRLGEYAEAKARIVTPTPAVRAKG